jgi:hypothetical protein
MHADALTRKGSLLLSPPKPFHLPVYAEKMASAFEEFGCSKRKSSKLKYAPNVLEFIDRSASECGEISDSSTTEDSATESTAT